MYNMPPKYYNSQYAAAFNRLEVLKKLNPNHLEITRFSSSLNALIQPNLERNPMHWVSNDNLKSATIIVSGENGIEPQITQTLNSLIDDQNTLSTAQNLHITQIMPTMLTNLNKVAKAYEARGTLSEVRSQYIDIVKKVSDFAVVTDNLKSLKDKSINLLGLITSLTYNMATLINDSLQINDAKHEKTGYLEQAKSNLKLLKQNYRKSL